MPIGPRHPRTTEPSQSSSSRSASPGENGVSLNGFERPSYFSGHLLTDADLTLEQSYFREKTRLYQRTLHGSGIVRGLRLTCDRGQPGGILVGKGYAIDHAGNDLVLGEPMQFDVVERLVEKALILGRPDPRRPETTRPEGDLEQCFYITIGYQEEPLAFSTPLIAESRGIVNDCLPTRIRESACLDVVDSLPEQHPRSLKLRLESCFKLFSEGEFAARLEMLSDIVSGKEEPNENVENLFSELKGYLLLHLNRNPDKYSRTIDQDIQSIAFPRSPDGMDTAPENYRERVSNAFSSLLSLAWQHAVSGALGEFIPSWLDPASTASVVLGTVVVENGIVVRVCNCPRSYVWSAANFPEVLLAELFGSSGCSDPGEPHSESGEREGQSKVVCCRPFDFDLKCFLQWIKACPKAPFYSSTELLRWIESVGQSIREGFDFTNPCNFSPKIFENLDKNKVLELLKPFGIRSRMIASTLENRAPHPLTMMQGAGLFTGEQTIVLTDDGVVTNAIAEPSHLLNQINRLQNQIDDLKRELKSLKPPGGQSPQSR